MTELQHIPLAYYTGSLAHCVLFKGLTVGQSALASVGTALGIGFGLSASAAGYRACEVGWDRETKQTALLATIYGGVIVLWYAYVVSH